MVPRNAMGDMNEMVHWAVYHFKLQITSAKQKEKL